MPRIIGINIPKDKRIEIALTYIYGLGRFSSRKILKSAKINLDKKAGDLDLEEIDRITAVIQKSRFKIESTLRTETLINIRRLKNIGCLKGTRHSKRLPVRGQRTKTNSRTVRGRAKITVGSGRVKQTKK